MLYGHVGQRLTVQFDLGQLQAVDELRILDVVQTASGVNADDPQLAEIALLQLAAGVGEIQARVRPIPLPTGTVSTWSRDILSLRPIFFCVSLDAYYHVLL